MLTEPKTQYNSQPNIYKMADVGEGVRITDTRKGEMSRGFIISNLLGPQSGPCCTGVQMRTLGLQGQGQTLLGGQQHVQHYRPTQLVGCCGPLPGPLPHCQMTEGMKVISFDQCHGQFSQGCTNYAKSRPLAIQDHQLEMYFSHQTIGHRLHMFSLTCPSVALPAKLKSESSESESDEKWIDCIVSAPDVEGPGLDIIYTILKANLYNEGIDKNESKFSDLSFLFRIFCYFFSPNVIFLMGLYFLYCWIKQAIKAMGRGENLLRRFCFCYVFVSFTVLLSIVRN